MNFNYSITSPFFFIKMYEIGVATNNEEYVPTMIPTAIENTNPLIESTPIKNIINNVRTVVKEVLIVRLIVLLTPWLNNGLVLRFGYSLVYSRIRSNTTTVSLIE